MSVINTESIDEFSKFNNIKNKRIALASIRTKAELNLLFLLLLKQELFLLAWFIFIKIITFIRIKGYFGLYVTYLNFKI